jgi:23S rRNA (cytidine1920-2'-O)/16S rRNA (cytidine1409-2'-O)-methyltransferase
VGRPKPVRLDKWLVDHGLAPSRHRARELIEEGRVLVDGLVVKKPARQVRPDRPVRVVGDAHEWVGRGARKLLGALDDLPMDVEGRIAADLGASTGGFTEVLLHAGARRVYAVDVGRGQLHQRLVVDPRVVVRDGVNARHLERLDEPIERVVGDLSFISLDKILPAVHRITTPDAEALVLVKPQFEAGRAAIARGGRVRPEAREDAIESVRVHARSAGFTVLGGADCVLPGARAGNVEYFLWLRKTGPSTEGPGTGGVSDGANPA